MTHATATPPHPRRLSLLLALCAWAAAPLAGTAEDSAAAYRRAYACLASNRLDEAAALFGRAAAATNGESRAAAWLGQGEALYRARRWSEAEAAYGALLAQSPDSPYASRALYARGLAEYKRGRLPEALATLSEFLARYPNHALAASATAATGTLTRTLAARVTRDETEKLRLALSEIDALSRDGARAPQTVSAVRAFLREHPGHPQAAALRDLAAAYAIKAKDRALTVDTCRDSLTNCAADAQSPKLRLALAEALDALGREAEASEAFAAVGRPDADVRSAELLFKTGRTAEALARASALQKQLAPSDAALASRAALVTGDCLTVQAKWEEAERTYLGVEVLLGDKAFQPVALERLAGLYEKWGRADEAARTRDELRRRYPDYPGFGRVGR